MPTQEQTHLVVSKSHFFRSSGTCRFDPGDTGCRQASARCIASAHGMCDLGQFALSCKAAGWLPGWSGSPADAVGHRIAHLAKRAEVKLTMKNASERVRL